MKGKFRKGKFLAPSTYPIFAVPSMAGKEWDIETAVTEEEKCRHLFPFIQKPTDSRLH